MHYVILGHDKQNSLEQRLKARPAHLDRLQALKNEGRLLLAGPFPAVDSINPGEHGFSGSMIVAEFKSLGAARMWADQDPYVAAGVYQTVDVRPFKKVFP